MKNQGEWIVKIYENPHSGKFEFYIFGNRAYGDVINQAVDLKTEEFQILKEGVERVPTMKMTQSMMQSLFEALHDYGLKPVEQSFLEGKLGATEKHLEDMRKIVFEPAIINITDEKRHG